MERTGLIRLGAAGLALIMVFPLAPLPASAATPPAESEPASPPMLTFPAGGGSDSTAISLERNTHIRDARLVMQGGTVETPTTYRLNATTWGAAQATAWSGELRYGTPDQSPAAYEAAPFNATRVANVSSRDGSLEKSPTATNFTYEMYAFRVLALDLVELRILWTGYALPPAMPLNWNGKVFLYNTTDLAWDEVAAYPFPLTGVQDVQFNATTPANYIETATGRVSVMIVSESTMTDVYTDFVEVTGVSGVYPRPAVDVGGEGGIDWRWDAPGWGALGRQTEFEDGLEVRAITLPPGGASNTSTILVPEGATLRSARMIVRSYPDRGSSNHSGGNVLVTAAGSGSLNATGLPTNAIGDFGTVRLLNLTSVNVSTDSNVVPRTGALRLGSDPNGWGAAGQSFNVSQQGPLDSVSVLVYQVVGNPGPVEASLYTLNATGIPTGVPLATAQVAQAALANSSWISFAFNGTLLSAGANLAIVFRAPLAPPGTSSNYVTLGASVNDSFSDGISLSYVNVTGLGESWSKPSGADVLVDIRQDLPSSSFDAAGIRVDGVAGSYSQSGAVSNLSVVVPGPSLTAGSHTFQVTNGNAFSIGFQWQARVDFLQLVKEFTVGIGGVASPMAQFANLTTGVDIDLTYGISQAVSVCSGSLLVLPGATLCPALLIVNGSSAGLLQLDSLDIRYTFSLTTPDLSAAFDSYLWQTPPNLTRASIPIRIYSPGASTLTILESAITYDRPPVYFDFPSTVTDEDVPLVTDLNTVFHDDWDNAALSFYVNQTSGFDNASIRVSGYNLTVNPLANRSGNLILTVRATDSRGLESSSGPVLFTIRPMNDPPRLTIDRINVSWGHIETVDLTPFIVDAEFPALAITISAATGTAVSVSERSLIFDFPVGAADVPMSITLSDGALSATYPLLVHPRQANTPPVLLPIPTVVIPDNAAWWMDLAPFVHDGEDNFSALAFSLAVPVADQNSLFWTIERTSASTFLKLIPRAGTVANITTQLTVTDTDGNANTTSLGVRVTPASDVPPRIVGIDPVIALGAESTTIFLATKYADPEDGNDPARVSWAVSNDNPELFTAEVDRATQRLVITPVPGASGTGSFSLVLRDSDGLQTSKSFTVVVPTSFGGSSASVLAVGLFFAGVVVFAAVAARRARTRGHPSKDTPLDAMKKEGATDQVALQVQEGAAEGDRMEMPAPERSEDVGSFLRGETLSPDDTPPAPDEGVVTLGLKSGLDGASAPAAAPLTLGPLGAKPHARLAELYLFSLKDGGMLFQAPPQGLPQLGQADESQFLQWAFDTVRKEEKVADAVKVLEWKGVPVVLARGAAFFVAGRARGDDFEPLKQRVRTLLEEVDSNFPGSTADWQRNDVVDTVADILKRLVR